MVSSSHPLRGWITLCEAMDQLVFHGTGRAFERLDPARSHLGIHFTSSKTAAIKFAGQSDGRVFVARISISNPIRMTDMKLWEPGAIIQELTDMRMDGIVFPDGMIAALKQANQFGPGYPHSVWTAMRALFLHYGYDGIVYDNTYEPAAGTCWIVFSASQIEVVDVLAVSGGGSPLHW